MSAAVRWGVAPHASGGVVLHGIVDDRCACGREGAQLVVDVGGGLSVCTGCYRRRAVRAALDELGPERLRSVTVGGFNVYGVRVDAAPRPTRARRRLQLALTFPKRAPELADARQLELVPRLPSPAPTAPAGAPVASLARSYGPIVRRSPRKAYAAIWTDAHEERAVVSCSSCGSCRRWRALEELAGAGWAFASGGPASLRWTCPSCSSSSAAAVGGRS